MASEVKLKAKHKSNDKIHAICGAVSGVFSKLILQPFDLIRTRFQVQDTISASKFPKYTSLPNALVTIVRKEGVQGLYTGALPNLFGSGMAWSIYFFSYSKIKDAIKHQTGRQELRQRELLFAGASCSTIVVLFTNPIWFLKTRMQLQSKVFTDDKIRYSGTFNAAMRIYREEGLRTFYRGLIPALSLTSTGVIQMLCYENLRKYALLFLSQRESAAAKLGCIKDEESSVGRQKSIVCYAATSKEPGELSAGQEELLSDTGSDQVQKKRFSKAENINISVKLTLLMGGVSKALAAFFTYPGMLVRARMYQRSSDDDLAASSSKQRYRNISHVISDVYRLNGPTGFYRGMTAHIAKSAPCSAITLSMYEFLLRKMDSKW